MRHWNKPDKTKGRVLDYSFLLYLWGIETWLLNSLNTLWLLFLLYLWGIETFWKIRLHQRVYAGFYSTYEALKLTMLILNRLLMFGFYSTYEALKRLNRRRRKRRNISFYSTYEALKHGRLNSLNSFRLVFTLPMRHWNDEEREFWSTHDSSGFYSTYEALKLQKLNYLS